jgi:hypothetical protein
MLGCREDACLQSQQLGGWRRSSAWTQEFRVNLGPHSKSLSVYVCVSPSLSLSLTHTHTHTHTHVESCHSHIDFFVWLVFCLFSGIEPRNSHLQAHYHLIPLLSVWFSDRVSCFCLSQPQTMTFPPLPLRSLGLQVWTTMLRSTV